MKKGFAGLDMVQWMIRLLFLTIVVFACVYLVNMLVKNDIDILDAEMDILYKRLIYSPNGIMYKDPVIDRSYPGIIDWEKLSVNYTDRVIDYGDPNNYIAARMEIIDPWDYQKVFFYNEFGYKKWIPLKGYEGAGGVETMKKQLPIIIYDHGKYEMKTIEVEIVTPRS